MKAVKIVLTQTVTRHLPHLNPEQELLDCQCLPDLPFWLSLTKQHGAMHCLLGNECILVRLQFESAVIITLLTNSLYCLRIKFQILSIRKLKSFTCITLPHIVFLKWFCRRPVRFNYHLPLTLIVAGSEFHGNKRRPIQLELTLN